MTTKNREIPTSGGYTQRFERRPEFELWGSLVKDVVDAGGVRQRTVDDLKIFKISDVFAGNDEIFIGFGKPNAYLVVPDGQGGYQKFAGKSLRRAPSRIEDTRGFVQSGVLVRLKNLPQGAAEALRQAMLVHNNVKFWTCVNAILHVMSTAGFTSPTKPLTKRYMPYSFMHDILHAGIMYEGKPVEFEIIRTTPEPLQRYASQVVRAELLTFCRHADRSLQGAAKKNRLAAFVYGLAAKPLSFVSADGKTKAAPKAPVAPALPDGIDYAGGIDVRVTGASMLVAFMRQFWGPHAFFEASQQRVDVNGFLQENLRPFPNPKPNLVTRLKKALLFSPLVVRGIRALLATEYLSVGERRECDIYDMLRTDSDKAPNKYNLVITDESISVARISVRAKVVDWILAKHVLMSGYHPRVRFAGEIWKDQEGVIHLNRNSGTYQPSEEQLQAAAAFLRAIFPNLKVVVDDNL